MKATAHRLLTLAAMFGLVASGCGDDGGSGSVSPTVSSRPLVDEAELSRDTSLHAVPEQVVVLHLDPMPEGSDLVEHTIRYKVDETVDLRFCIPANEPHVTHLDLVAAGSGEMLVRAERGDTCNSVTLSPGTYALHVFHDGAEVPAPGASAFLHRPGKRAASGGAGAATAFAVPDFIAFRYAGQFVTDLNPESAPVCELPLRAGGGTRLDAHSVFRMTPTTTADVYELQDGTGASVVSNFFNAVPFVVGAGSRNCGNLELEILDWKFIGSANGQFNLCSPTDGCLVVDPAMSVWPYPASLILASGAGSTFTTEYKGYACTTCDSSALPLQEGEVALFSQLNFQGPAFVFQTDVPDFSIYDPVTSAGLAIGDNDVQSVRVGPNTLVYLYHDASYAGAAVGVATDVSSLAGTVVGNLAASSMHVSTIGDYFVETKACEGCILTGADLGDLDLTGADFYGAKLANADLSGTKLREARLDNAVLSGAKLSGADFTAARLQCANFSDSDLTDAQFASLHGPLLVVDREATAILKTDPTSGARIQISGTGVGSGPPFGQPFNVALSSDGTLWVADLDVGVVRVDAITGARTAVWPWPNSSSAAQIGSPTDIAVNSAGQLLVLGPVGVARVDPANGTSTLVSGPAQGTGVSFGSAFGIAIDGAGRLIVVDFQARALIAVDPVTGNRTILSNDATGTGPHFVRPLDVAIDAQGNLFVADNSEPASVLKVDPSSGDRTRISGSTLGTGPRFQALFSIAAALDGTLFVTDTDLGAVVRVDPTTGDRTIISNAATGSGPAFSSINGLAMGPTLASDFSCRLIANAATIDAGPGTQTFPLASWRYMDLTNAVIRNATVAPLSTTTAPLDLSGAILSGASGLSGAVLDGVNLGCATPLAPELNCSKLIGTDLHDVSLQGASAANASLQGSNLDYTNLLNADLSAAMLGAAQGGGTPGPASLFGAYMPNVNLGKADLRYVDLTSAHLYGTVALVDTLLDGANLSNAICSGAQFQGASLAGAVLDGAQLVNCGFDMADLTDASFDTCYLQGADFNGAAKVEGVRLNNAAVSTMQGSWAFTEQGGTQVLYAYGATTLGALATDTSVICPSGENGGCTGDKLTPVANGPFPPIPACVPMPPDYDNCLPPAPPAAAQ